MKAVDIVRQNMLQRLPLNAYRRLSSIETFLQLYGFLVFGVYGTILPLSLGNIEDSRIFARPRIWAVIRSSPMASPPCGGIP